MNRRDTLRLSILTIFGFAAQQYDALALQDVGGSLSCNLSRYRWLVFVFQGKQVTVPMSEAFAALEEAYGSTKVK